MSVTGATDFSTDRHAVNDALRAVASESLGAMAPAAREAIQYALAGEGKRLRAILFLSAYRAAGGTRDATGLAVAIEIVHAYSLIHDDLPCMDDDDVRRGRPTVHKAFGVRTATAAGLAMVPLAASVAYDGARAVGLSDVRAAEIVRELMRAAGAGGMIGGQLLDLEGEGQALSLGQLERVHSLKTGALIAASVRLGAMAAAPGRFPDAFSAYGRAVGLAFQIADDVLDVTATSDQLGKTAGKDVAHHKSTYPGLLGIEGARARAVALAESGCLALEAVGALTAELRDLARYAVARNS